MSQVIKQETWKLRGLTQKVMSLVCKQMSCCGPVPEAEAEAEAEGCFVDILRVMVLDIYEVSSNAVIYVSILGSLFLQAWNLFNLEGSFSVRTLGLNAAAMGELLAWDFELGKDGWSGGPLGYVGKAGG